MERMLGGSKATKTTVYLILAMYVAGFIGLNLAFTQSLFRLLVPFHLFSNALLLLAFHRDWNCPFTWFACITFLTGFLVEVLGVKTGSIFGVYWYGATLGFKLWDIPVVIGANWLVLVYSTGVVCNRLPIIWPLKALLASLMMTGLDYLIEPVAIHHDFWQWQHQTIPLQNFIGWILTAFLLHTLFYLLPFEKKNPLAGWVYGIQLAFFVLHWPLI
jgi:putative membrane protein